MNTDTVTDTQRLRTALAAVRDPEIRVLSIEELGILRDVQVDQGQARVTITPTYMACPAMDLIRADIRTAAAAAGFADVLVDTVWTPAWTTDWISPAARGRLRAAGIAPPRPGPAPTGTATAPAGTTLLPLLTPPPPCPRCGSTATSELSRFGSTACKALWLCGGCREPFDHFKEH